MIGPDARNAWSEIEQRLLPYVARRVEPAAVDDVVQEIFLRVHRGIAGLRDGERFGGWVYRVASHVIADHHRARARDAAVREGDSVEAADEGNDETERLQTDLGECVTLFVARLPSPYREAITLTELEGLMQKDAAEMLGISLSGMKSRVQRGREKIREMFDECCRISVDPRGRVVECTARPPNEVPADCRAAAVAWAARRPEPR
jgi:RNA polymerase sigma-70 factor (ECF subfamily)